MPLPPFELIITEDAFEHLADYRAFERGIIIDAIRVQLTYQPDNETRNRKPLREHPLASWELRVQNYRVFYNVDRLPEVVRVVAIGHKVGSRLIVGGEEFKS